MKRFTLAVMLILVACSRSSANQRSVLGISNCELPCWNGIIVGQTSEQAVIQNISAIPFVDKDSILITNKAWNIFDNQIFFSFSAKSGFKANSLKSSEIDIANGRAQVITLCGNLHLTLGKIAQEVGEPEDLISGGSITGGRDVILLNPRAGVAYWYNTRDVSKELELEIKPDIELQCLAIFDASSFEKFLDAGMFSMGHYNAKESFRVMYPWDGYGNLDEKYLPRQP